MDSKVIRADFGSGLICPKGSNILRAEIQRTLRRAPRQLRRLRLGLQTRRGSNHSTAHVGESNFRSNGFQFRRTSTCVPSRWKVLSGEFRRRPTEFVIKLRNLDCVGRRGLSEPREDFSRLNTFAFPQLISADRFRGCKSCSNSPPSNRRKFLRNRLDLLFIRLHNNAQWSPKLNVTAKSSS